MSVLCSSLDIEGEYVLHILWHGLEDPQAGQDMVGSIHDHMMYFYVEVHLEIKLNAELDKCFQSPQARS